MIKVPATDAGIPAIEELTARWLALRAAGARPQRPLWASTGTKDPAYSDVLYVEGLIRPGVVNTMPEATLRAFADHGDANQTLPVAGPANETLRRARSAGIDLDAVTAELEREGVRSFCDSYHELLVCIDAKAVRDDARHPRPARSGV